MRPQTPAALTAAAVLCLLTAMLLTGHGPLAGPSIIEVTERHGLNAGDVPVIISWVIGLAAIHRLHSKTR